MKQVRNFKRKYDYKQFKYKIIFILGSCLFAAKFCADFFYCMPSSIYSQEDFSFWEFWKIIIVIWILERYIGSVGEGLLRAHISSIFIIIFWINFCVHLTLEYNIVLKCYSE